MLAASCSLKCFLHSGALPTLSKGLGLAAAAQNLARASYSTVPEPDDDSHLYAEQLNSPNFIHPISLSQLEQLVRQPILRRVTNSATFLKSQLPARLENHIYRLRNLPTPNSTALRELLSSTVTSKLRGLEVSQDWKLVDTSTPAGLHHFESHLGAFREHLEVEVSRMTAAAQQLTETQGWWSDPQQVRWLNRLLDLCHWYLLSARVMLTQHTAALHSLEQQTAAVSSPGGHGRTEPVVAGAAASATAGKATVAHYHEPGHRSTDPGQAYTPPHQQLVDMQPVSLIARNAPVMRIVRNVAEDCRAFCVEKNSAAPDVQFKGNDSTTALLVVPYVEFVLTEVLKNALQAVVKRYGAWEVDDAPPVMVEVVEVAGSSGQGSSATAGQDSGPKVSSISIRITDMGSGIPADYTANMFSYFYTSNKPASTLYGYSRNHGSQFQGQGVGVPMSRVYAHFMGGSIEWETEAWRRHTTVNLTLPRNGFTF